MLAFFKSGRRVAISPGVPIGGRSSLELFDDSALTKRVADVVYRSVLSTWIVDFIGNPGKHLTRARIVAASGGPRLLIQVNWFGRSDVSDTRPSWLLVVTMLWLVGMSRDGLSQEANLTAAPHGTDSPQKFENGFQICWRNIAHRGDPNPSKTDSEAAIEIFDRSANELAVCHVANAIRTADPSASGVSIYDVSARKPGFIAVAAVYTERKQSNRWKSTVQGRCGR